MVDLSDLTPDQQALFRIAQGVLPRVLFQSDGARQEFLKGCAATFDHARAQIDTWLGVYTFITKSVGMWVDQHGKDRGIYRQAGEDDATLIARIRFYQDVVTPDAVASAINAVLAASGLPECALVELRRDGAHWGTFASTGRARFYWSRGYRYLHSGRPNKFVVILPYGTTPGIAAAVSDAIRLKKAGGIGYSIEVRTSP